MARQTSTPEPKLVSILKYEPVVGGDNTTDHRGGRVTIAAWGLRDDGSVVVLVREGATLVIAEPAPEPAPEPEPEPEPPPEPEPEPEPAEET